jgi:hypothetical protein
VIEAFLRRRNALDAYVRSNTANQLAVRFRPRLIIPADTVSDDEKFLEEVVTEYRARPYR